MRGERGRMDGACDNDRDQDPWVFAAISWTAKNALELTLWQLKLEK
jgi:hypothetical protein